MKDKSRYIVIDIEAGCTFKTNELTPEIKLNIHEGYSYAIDLETMETIHSNKDGLFRRPIQHI